MTEMDWEAAGALARTASDGADDAWETLVEQLWPWWLKRLGHSRELGSLAKDEDHVHAIAVRLVDKLAPRGGGALGLFEAWQRRHPGKGFEDWIRIVTAFTTRDHVRSVLGQSQKRDPDLPSAKRLLNEFSRSPAIDEVGGWRPGYTTAQCARQLLEYAEQQLPGEQLEAILLWLEGARYPEIAAQLGGDDAEEARRLVRAGIATLRRAFAVR